MKSDKYSLVIDEFIEKNEDNMVKDLQSLIAIKSIKGEKKPKCPFGEQSANAILCGCEIADHCGLNVQNLENYVAYCDLLGDDGMPFLGILTHLDVVPQGNGWTYPPFDGVVENGKVFGRGAIDDKGPSVSVLYALKAINELEIPLKKSVRFIMGSDEESGSGEDIDYYLNVAEMPPFVFTPDGDFPVINGEKGMLKLLFEESFNGDIISISGGETINAVPSLAFAEIKNVPANEIEKTIFNEKLQDIVTFTENDGIISITVKGVNAHASTPQKGINANTLLLHLLKCLPLASCNQIQAIKSISEAFPPGDNLGTALGIGVSDSISGDLTCVLSIISANTGRFQGKADVRFPVTKTKIEICDLIEKSFIKKGLKLKKITGTSPHYTDENSDFVQTLLTSYTMQTGKEGRCISIGGGTYVHDINGGVAFGVMKPGEDNHMHGADEFIAINALKENAKLFAKVIINLCS